MSDIGDAVGLVGSGGGKFDNVADNDESGSKYERAFTTCMESGFNRIFQCSIECTYLLTSAVFSSGRNQFLESLRAFGDIVTKKEFLVKAYWDLSAKAIPFGKHLHDVFQRLREGIPSTTFLVKL